MKFNSLSRRLMGAVFLLAASFGFSACNGASGSVANAAGEAAAVAATGLPWTDDAPAAKDPNQITLALKYVSYLDSKGNPVIDPEGAKKVLHGINSIYSKCNVRFQIDDYQAVEPASYGLEYGLTSMSQLEPTRTQFDDSKMLVVVNTGNWNHGSIGSANAWTAMPGTQPSGAVIEGQVADSAGIIAHELGHYLSLDHVSDTSDLMNPIIYPTSTTLTQSQCDSVRQAAENVRAAARR